MRRHIGPIAAPDAVVISDLPKTRSGKIMRRLLRKLMSGDSDLGDTYVCFLECATLDRVT